MISDSVDVDIVNKLILSIIFLFLLFQSRFEFPCDVEVSEDAKDLIKKLICSADQRFGRTGLEEFKQHPWFSGIDWANIRESKHRYFHYY